MTGFEVSPVDSWLVIGCSNSGYACPDSHKRPYATRAVAVVNTYVENAPLVKYAQAAACLSTLLDNCRLACTNMPACRGIATLGGSLVLLVGDGSMAAISPHLARCGTQQVACPTANLTFAIPGANSRLWLVGHDVTIGPPTVQETSISVLATGALATAYIPLPVVRPFESSSDSALYDIIACSIILPLAIAGTILWCRFTGM